MKDASGLMLSRACLVEHPFGTIKCRAGYRHFLVRGFDRVRGEWSLMALCYNFTRVLNILGFDRFMAYLAQIAQLLLLLLQAFAILALSRPAGPSVRSYRDKAANGALRICSAA